MSKRSGRAGLPGGLSLSGFAAPPQAGALFGSFFRGLPGAAAGAEFRHLVRDLSGAVRAGKRVVVGIGDPIVACGLSPVLIDLMRRGWISAIAMCRAAALRDIEVARDGAGAAGGSPGTDLEAVAPAGGAALGRQIAEAGFHGRSRSVLAAAVELGVPATVHAAGSEEDFRPFCDAVARLQDGVYLNLGSDLLLERFFEALAAVRKQGQVVANFVTAEFNSVHSGSARRRDVLRRLAGEGCRRYAFGGHYEFLVPMLAQALVDALEDRAEASARKVISVEEARTVRERLGGVGATVVFTNGCFDLLHRGHVTYLQKARSLGDALFLGLNSDDSVRRVKGPERPIICIEDRICILAGLEAVDYICVFEADTPCDLIRAISPDILVKGGDYRLDEVVGREIVEAAGGRVTTIPYIEGRSTTGIVRQIRKGGANDNVLSE